VDGGDANDAQQEATDGEGQCMESDRGHGYRRRTTDGGEVRARGWCGWQPPRLVWEGGRHGMAWMAAHWIGSGGREPRDSLPSGRRWNQEARGEAQARKDAGGRTTERKKVGTGFCLHFILFRSRDIPRRYYKI
jgi:hypothetical protein